MNRLRFYLLTAGGIIAGTAMGFLFNHFFKKSARKTILKLIENLENKGLSSDIIYKEITKELTK